PSSPGIRPDGGPVPSSPGTRPDGGPMAPSPGTRPGPVAAAEVPEAEVSEAEAHEIDAAAVGAGRGGLFARLALAAGAAVAYEASVVALTATATWLLCRAAGRPPLGVLAVAVVLVRALAIGRGAFRYAERLAGHDAVLALMARLRGRFFERLVPLAPGRLPGYRTGDLLARLASDVDAVQELLLRVALPAVAVLSVGTAGTAWATALLPAVGPVLAAGLVLAGLVLPATAALVMHRTDVALAAARADLAARTVDLVEGLEDLLLNGGQETARRWGRTAADAVEALERGRARWLAALTAVGLLVQLTTCAAVGWTAWHGGLDRVTATVLVLTTLTLLEETLQLRAAGERLGTLIGAVRRVGEVLRLRVPDEPAQPVPAPAPPVSLTLTDVSVTYPGAAAPALSGVTLSVPAGARVALVGPSGSGKSTVLALALRLLRADRGRVALGGVDIGELDGAALRPGLVGGLVQEAALFTGSVRANLLLADPHATDERLTQVLARVGAAQWVRRLPDGLDTWIGRRGDRLSGGERQRLLLALALLSDPAVLVLDEPTESLDRATADAVLADTLAATAGRAGRTVLLVSHRLHGLEEFDDIIVLEGGRITQRGPHARLVAEPGHYRERWHAEARKGF
ncbi:thiol reductant ABC exporter subunit CydC, partial [Streptomyces sp. NPDC127079]|uniref:thiol reductant ABC exporter subunit CydC n=1 Tax=Streptomyces sp. NPDC127079 TaxID=3347132 RepID=UPI00365E01EC